MNTGRDINPHPQPPYPHVVLYGRLRLAGLSDDVAYRVTDEVMRSVSEDSNKSREGDIFERALNRVGHINSTCYENMTVIAQYERRRRESPETPPLIVALEGASATGKSMLALTLATDIVATRLLSTDTIRQVLRATHSREEVPELFCHTYQAHKYKQVGPDTLPPVVRGFLAQYAIIEPHLKGAVKNISAEGATGLVEGVHIVPGDFHDITGVVEVLVEPSRETHKSMFMDKSHESGLTTITVDQKTRMKEFEAARAIQEYMLDMARESETGIVRLETYAQAIADIRTIIISHMKRLVQ